MADPSRIYRALLRLYPARFREEFGGPLERQMRDEYEESSGGARFWARTLWDVARSAPVEFAREVFADVRYSLRVYSKRPLAVSLAIAALAMAIGATVGVFSVVNGLLLRSLPFRDPGRLYSATVITPMNGRTRFHEWRAHSAYLEDAASYITQEMNFSAGSDPVRVKVTETTGNFFSLLGTEPVLGRGFTMEDDAAGHDSVAVISYTLWQQLFSGDPRVLGRTVLVNGAPLTITGVARPALDFPGRTAVWTPTVFDLNRIPKKNGAFFFASVVRLKLGVSVQQAISMMHAEVRAMHPDYNYDQNPDSYPDFISLRDSLSGHVRDASFAMLAAAGFVLLIACANVANLLLTRVAERKPELAVRAALGASRARLVQQLITESVLLSTIAGAAGLAIAVWVARLASLAQPAQLAVQGYTILDARVLAFAAGVAVLTGALFGVFPAWISARTQPLGDAIRIGSVGRISGAAMLRRMLITGQVSLTLILLAGSMVMGRAFLRMVGTDLGFKTGRVVAMSVSLVGTRFDTAVMEQQYFDEALTRLRSISGVESAGGVDVLPLGDFATTGFLGMSGTLDTGQPTGGAMFAVTDDYFRTMGIEMVRGREFTSTDRAGAAPVAVVNEDFANTVADPAHLLGRKLTIKVLKKTVTIVGIAHSFRAAGPQYSHGFPNTFLPTAQTPRNILTFVAKVHGDPSRYLALCRDAVQGVDRGVAVFNAQTLDDRLANTLARPRFYTTAVLFLCAFAMLLAIVGIYGVAAHSVAQRTHEIGVRMALGAPARGVRWMILRQGLLPVALGMALGIGGSVGLGRFFASLVDATEVSVSPSAYAGAVLLLAITAALATWSGTRKVARLDPIEILRAE